MLSRKFLEQLVNENRELSSFEKDYHAGRADMAQDLINILDAQENLPESKRYICNTDFVVPKVNLDGTLSGDSFTVKAYSLWQVDLKAKSSDVNKIRLTQVDGFHFIETTKEVLEENFSLA